MRGGINTTMLSKPSITFALTPNYISLATMDSSLLAEHYTQELKKHHRGEQFDECYGLELFRRTTIQHDATAWKLLQQCLQNTMHQWLLLHPRREEAYSIDSQAHYIIRAYEMFWDRSVYPQHSEFFSLADALKALYICLNAVILETLRDHAQATLLSHTLQEFYGHDASNSTEVWELLQEILPNTRELRLAYLLLHCGLKPGEILSTCPGEFRDLTEIYHLHSTIIARILRSVAASNTPANMLFD
jgi:hypothetical protein